MQRDGRRRWPIGAISLSTALLLAASVCCADILTREARAEIYASANPSETSSEGIRVGGKVLQFEDRNILLGFIRDLRKAYSAALRQPAGSQASIYIGCEAADYSRMPSGTVSRASAFVAAECMELSYSGPAVWVVLPYDLANADPRDTASEIVSAWTRYFIASKSRSLEICQYLPDWFTSGLTRSFDEVQRRKDFEAVRRNWYHAKYPTLAEVLAEPVFQSCADMELASQIVAFWLSFPDVATRFESLCTRLAAGEHWTADMFLETSCGTTSPRQADNAYDAWLYKRSSKVFVPGTTSHEDVRRALVAMQLFAGEDGVPADFATTPQPIERLFEKSSAPWAAETARKKAADLMLRAAGRSDAFRKPADEITRILFDFANGKSSKKAPQKIRAALSALGDSAD